MTPARRRPDRLTLVLFASLVAMHVATGLLRRTPILFADELGYLGPARFFVRTGVLPFMGRVTFYHVGYPLVIAPASLFADPHTAYRAVMVTNALLVGLLFLALLAIARRFAPASDGDARLCAFTAALYPALLPAAKLARGEVLLALLFALSVVTLHRLLEAKSWAAAAAFGACTGAMYAVHGRGVVVPSVGLALVLTLALVRVVPWASAAISAAVTGSILVAAKALNDLVRVRAYSGPSDLEHMFGSSLKLGGGIPKWFFFAAAGQLWYLLAASYGLVLLGVFALVAHARRNGATIAQRAVALYCCLSVLAVFVLSTFFTLHGPTADDLVYGRYNELFVPVVLVAGLLALRQWTSRRLVVAAALTLGCAFLIHLGPNAAKLQTTPDTENVLGIEPWIRLFGGLHLMGITLLALAVGTVLVVLARRRVVASVCATGVLFLALGLVTFALKTMPKDAQITRRIDSSDVTRAAPRSVSYDLATRKGTALRLYQWRLTRTTFYMFDSRSMAPRTRAVIAGEEWSAGDACGARRVADDRAMGQALWILPADGISCLDGRNR